MPVEELDVTVEVLVEIATSDERPCDRPDRVDGEPQGEEDNRSQAPARELLEPGERAHRQMSVSRYDRLATAPARAGLRKR